MRFRNFNLDIRKRRGLLSNFQNEFLLFEFFRRENQLEVSEQEFVLRRLRRV